MRFPNHRILSEPDVVVLEILQAAQNATL